VLGVVVLGLVAFGIHNATSALMPEASITSLHIVRTSAFPQSHIPPFEMTVTDATKAQQVYDTMRYLSSPRPGIYHCGLSIGVAYVFTFTRHSGSPIEATATTIPNCGVARFAHGGTGFAGSDFWNSVAKTLGVPISDFYVTPNPNGTGPLAPTPVPSDADV
jgi:hypothetical protein